MSNWQSIIGHEWATTMLAQMIRHGRIGHAYLITGPTQVGKTTLARLLAQALNCLAPEAERPCGACRACVLIAADRHPDVRLVLPEVSARGKPTLKIDQIRSLQQALSLAAYEARYKVAILKQFDAATDGAANAFLKTLEEPPQNVILLLTAGDADTLLPTIASRCRTIALRPLPASLIKASLQERWQVAAEQAHLLAHLADGRLGWAVRAAQDATVLRQRTAELELLYHGLGGNRVSRFDLADRLTRKPETLPALLRTWLSWWRDLNLLAQAGDNEHLPLTNLDQRTHLEHWAQTLAAEQTLAAFKQTNLALWQLEHNANARLVIENLFLAYPLGSVYE